jgi:hypothetical protein
MRRMLRIQRGGWQAKRPSCNVSLRRQTWGRGSTVRRLQDRCFRKDAPDRAGRLQRAGAAERLQLVWDQSRSAAIDHRYRRNKNGGDHFDRRRELSNQLSFRGAT